jgi:hypothetical protein
MLSFLLTVNLAHKFIAAHMPLRLFEIQSRRFVALPHTGLSDSIRSVVNDDPNRVALVPRLRSHHEGDVSNTAEGH